MNLILISLFHQITHINEENDTLTLSDLPGHPPLENCFFQSLAAAMITIREEQFISASARDYVSYKVPATLSTPYNILEGVNDGRYLLLASSPWEFMGLAAI